MRNPAFAFLNSTVGLSNGLDALSQSFTDNLGAGRDHTCRLPSSTRIMTSRKPALATQGLDVTVLVFGMLYSGDPVRLERTIRDATGAIEAAEALTNLAWGSYVAFLQDRRGSYAFRDPSGALPLHIARFEHLEFASTAITPSLLRKAGLSWRIDHAAVAKLLANPPAAGYLSAIAEVEIVVPGRLVSLNGRRDCHTVWSPGAVARRRRELPADALSDKLDDVLTRLTKKATTGVELSGGFDSSVVFSSLAKLDLAPKPFNFATVGKGGDEVHFARDVAARWGLPLRTYSSGTELPSYCTFDAADHGVQPILHGLDSVFAKARQDMINAECLDQVMTGQGGDALFFRLPTRLVAADRRREMGLSSLFARSIVDDARRVNGSIWSVLTTAFGRRTGDDRPQLEWTMSHLLGTAATEHLSGPQPRHPWLEDCDDLPPAKVFHLMMLSHCQLFHGGRLFAPTVPVIHPLLTQPLVEMTIACPTYLLQRGPTDRGLAREAFRDRLPHSVLHRRSKGEASDHYARAVLDNVDWLKCHLLEGRLRDARLLNAVAIEQATKPNEMRLGTDYRAFVQYASIESWMRYWG